MSPDSSDDLRLPDALAIRPWLGALRRSSEPMSAHDQSCAPVLTWAELHAGVGMRGLLALSDVQLHRTLEQFGLLLLGPSLRRLVDGEALRRALATLGPQALDGLRWLPWQPALRDLLDSDAQDSDGALNFDRFSHHGADAALVAALRWLESSAAAGQPGLWALLLQRLRPSLQAAMQPPDEPKRPTDLGDGSQPFGQPQFDQPNRTNDVLVALLSELAQRGL